MMLRDDNHDPLEPSPIDKESEDLAHALFELMDAKEKLNKAIKNVPEYTGQYSEADFYSAEQDAYNKAAIQYKKAVMAVFNKETP